MPSITTSSGERALTVSELNAQASELLETGFAGIAVEGEISELVMHRSGHWYFTLKDDRAMLRVAMFRLQNQRLRFTPKNGDKVQARGKLGIYAARGSFQLVIHTLEPAGSGELLMRYNALKEELAALGWFDSDNKQPLPEKPRQIALITAAGSAALSDLLATFARRDPLLELILLPVAVQGETASTQIANAIATVNRLAQSKRALIAPEAIVIARGGGSLEDLWAFNERNLALSIQRSALPVISAVGHESDTSIADLVADVRAATPTAAAELLSSDRQQTWQDVQSQTQRLCRAMQDRLERASTTLRSLGQRLRSPASKLGQQAQSLDYLDNRLLAAVERKLEQRQHRLSNASLRLERASPAVMVIQRRERYQQILQGLQQATTALQAKRQQRLQAICAALHLVSPLATLARGYTISSDSEQNILRSVAAVQVGDTIQTRFADGLVSSEITAIQKQD